MMTEKYNWAELIKSAAGLLASGAAKPDFPSLAKVMKVPLNSLKAGFYRNGVRKEDLASLPSKVLNAPPPAPEPEAAPTQSESFEQAGDTINITLGGTHIHTLEELVEYAKIDLSVWSVERFVVNSWEIGRKARQVDLAYEKGAATGTVKDTGQIKREQLFQVKATLVKKIEKLAIMEEIESLKKDAMKGAPLWRPVERAGGKKSGNMLELSIPDLHMGKFAWSKETGGADYDVKIAERVFGEAVETLLARIDPFRPEQIVFVLGNDLLHADNVAGTTTAGTQMDTGDSRYHKTFRTTRLMITRAIERLRLLAPVQIMTVEGNHDTLAAWHLSDSIQCYFHDAPDVEVVNDPQPRKYMRWGKVMLMFTHPGQKGKLADYPGLMASEMPKMWGETRFHECHVGDLHQVRLEETHGVRVRILPSLAPADRWHSRHGFTGNLRSAEAYVWHKEEGLVGQAIYTVPE